MRRYTSLEEDAMTKQKALTFLQLTTYYNQLSPAEQEELLEDVCHYYGKSELQLIRDARTELEQLYCSEEQPALQQHRLTAYPYTTH